jgi:hypothetical protein
MRTSMIEIAIFPSGKNKGCGGSELVLGDHLAQTEFAFLERLNVIRASATPVEKRGT